MKFEFEVVEMERETFAVDMSTRGREWSETEAAAWREAEFRALMFAGPARTEGARLCVRMKTCDGARSLSDWRELGPRLEDVPAM